MKRLDIKLSSCHGCYFLNKKTRKLHTESQCSYHGENRLIYSGHHWKDIHTIPEWCPLPDYNPYEEEEKK